MGLSNSAEQHYNNNDLLDVSQRFSDTNEPFHTPNGNDIPIVEEVHI